MTRAGRLAPVRVGRFDPRERAPEETPESAEAARAEGFVVLTVGHALLTTLTDALKTERYDEKRRRYTCWVGLQTWCTLAAGDESECDAMLASAWAAERVPWVLLELCGLLGDAYRAGAYAAEDDEGEHLRGCACLRGDEASFTAPLVPCDACCDAIRAACPVPTLARIRAGRGL